MPVRVSNINIYLDGGSIEFSIDRGDGNRAVWLDTPFNGEPRTLKIDSVVSLCGEPSITSLLKDLDEWWASLSSDIQKQVRSILEQQGPFFNPSLETLHAFDLSHVCFVRNYLLKNYVF